MDADFSGFIVGKVNSGLFKGFLYPEDVEKFPFTTPSARSAGER
jgi:hypothetical protein